MHKMTDLQTKNEYLFSYLNKKCTMWHFFKKNICVYQIKAVPLPHFLFVKNNLQAIVR